MRAIWQRLMHPGAWAGCFRGIYRSGNIQRGNEITVLDATISIQNLLSKSPTFAVPPFGVASRYAVLHRLPAVCSRKCLTFRCYSFSIHFRMLSLSISTRCTLVFYLVSCCHGSNAAIFLPVANCPRNKWLEASVGQRSGTLRRTAVSVNWTG